ncbi:uncharacterized protein BJ171DRAFT_18992 [Polychytrium aggregatum]|uniref:uncharacterized protein n=1 Tax=Polychytrium aggregatum TaxID=110093 RepID=UPI0022FE8A3A|nr:uncharacterized protein BJ171DRAFT_18992 [Polychytrium aggregatum]KAI9206796.1 hypothetical protein BJ171DRAFT_18992 [Polychytrium aggregatum]
MEQAIVADSAKAAYEDLLPFLDFSVLRLELVPSYQESTVFYQSSHYCNRCSLFTFDGDYGDEQDNDTDSLPECTCRQREGALNLELQSRSDLLFLADLETIKRANQIMSVQVQQATELVRAGACLSSPAALGIVLDGIGWLVGITTLALEFYFKRLGNGSSAALIGDGILIAGSDPTPYIQSVHSAWLDSSGHGVVPLLQHSWNFAINHIFGPEANPADYPVVKISSLLPALASIPVVQEFMHYTNGNI